jgi:hypothetical protein
MKKAITLALAFVMALSLSLLTACGGGDSNGGGSSTTPPANSGTTTTPPADNTPSGGVSDDELNDAWEQAKDWAHEQGPDGEGYHFPQVENIREWPPATVWTELGLPELTPDKLENGEIYNDGNTHVDGYSDTFAAQCNTDEAAFTALAQKLWDAGIKGTNIGGGRVIPAEDIEWLIDDDPNYLWYRAYYEHNGDLMQVYLQYTNGWDNILWVGVTYAPSDPDFEQYPEISWPAADIEELVGVDLPNPGGTVYGVVNRDGYAGVELVVEGVSQAGYDTYTQNLADGKTPGIMKDEGDMSTDIHGYYGNAFYSENYDAYPAYIDINYVGGVMLISVVDIG